MYQMRDGWTDERMDDFRDEVYRRFDKAEGDVNRRFDEVYRRFDTLEGDVDRRFDEVDKRFDKFEGDVDRRFDEVGGRFDKVDHELARINDRFDGLYRATYVVGGGIVAALIGGIAAVVATQP